MLFESPSTTGHRRRTTWSSGPMGSTPRLGGPSFGGPEARLAGQVGWRFVVDGHPGIDGWNGWLGRDRGFLALGIGSDRVYGVGDIRSTDGIDPTGGELEAFKRLFDGYPEPVPSLLARLRSSDELWFSPFEEVSPPTWTQGSGRAHRRRRSCHGPEHGRGRIAGDRGRARPGRMPVIGHRRPLPCPGGVRRAPGSTRRACPAHDPPPRPSALHAPGPASRW